MNKYISNHPFIFMVSLALIASCFYGGFFVSAQAEKEIGVLIDNAPELTPTTKVTLKVATETPNAPTSQVIETTPTIEEVTSTVSIALLPETATIPPTIPSPMVQETAIISTAPLQVHFIDVGQGDAILIISPEGKIALIDGGSHDSGLLAHLKKLGVKRIDIMIATHPNEDHIGGLIQVLDTMPVAKVITNGQPRTTVTYEHFLDGIMNSEAEYYEVKRGDTIALGILEFLVMSPGEYKADALNENSIVLKLVYSQTTFLFMGDAGFEAEANLLTAGVPLKATILKIGHHGSCSATSPAFIQAVQPVVGIYSAGINNQYGHPCSNTISALDQRGVLIFGTDIYGSIIITVTSDGYRITDSYGKELGK